VDFPIRLGRDYHEVLRDRLDRLVTLFANSFSGPLSAILRRHRPVPRTVSSQNMRRWLARKNTLL